MKDKRVKTIIFPGIFNLASSREYLTFSNDTLKCSSGEDFIAFMKFSENFLIQRDKNLSTD